MEWTAQARIEIPDSSFDFVILHHVLEHILTPEETLTKVCAKLKPGGFIWIAFPSVRSLSLPSADGTLQFCDDSTHVFLPAVREVSNILLRNGVRILHVLSYFGVAEVEILFDPTTSTGYLIEVNARPWLQYGLPYACGLDLLGFATDRTGGADGPRSQSHAWLYFTSDLYACFSRSSGLVRTGKVAPLRYLRSILGADVYATWDWRDPGPLLEAFGRTVNGRWQRLVGRPRPAS